MKRIFLSSTLACVLASSLNASYVIKPNEMIDIYDDSINKTSIQANLIKSLNPDDSFKWHYARYFEGKSKTDLYFRDISVRDDKLLAAGSYHSSIVLFDLKNDNIVYNDFYAIKDADHSELGKKYPEATDDAKKQEKVKEDSKTDNNNDNDEWSGASELFVEQVEFIDDKTAFVNTMPKYLGRDNKNARPYLHHSGLHKIKLDNSGDLKELAFLKGEYFLFRKYKDGVIALDDKETFSIFDKNLKLIKSFKIKDVVKADVRLDRLFVLLKGENKGIYEYDIKKSKLNKIADFNAQYFGRPIKATTSPFLVSPDAKNIYYATPHNYNSKLCKVSVLNHTTECSNTGFALYSGSYAISPDGKTLAYTFGDRLGQTSIFNIENKPYLAGSIKGGNVSYAATFKDNNTLIVSNNRRNIDIYDLSKGKSISIDDKFENLKANIFSFIAPNMENIKIKMKNSGGKEKIKSDIIFPQHIDGINIVYLLPDEFADFVDEKGKIFALPKNDLSGEFSVILKLCENGKIIREEALTTPFNIKVSK